MAVDTQEKMMSATQFLLPFYTRGVFPDGVEDFGKLQAYGHCYSGIEAVGEGVAGVFTPYYYLFFVAGSR